MMFLEEQMVDDNVIGLYNLGKVILFYSCDVTLTRVVRSHVLPPSSHGRSVPSSSWGGVLGLCDSGYVL